MDKTQSKTRKSQIKIGLSKEDEINIGLEMIPMFQAKEEELTAKFEKIKMLKDELNSFKKAEGIKIR